MLTNNEERRGENKRIQIECRFIGDTEAVQIVDTNSKSEVQIKENNQTRKLHTLDNRCRGCLTVMERLLRHLKSKRGANCMKMYTSKEIELHTKAEKLKTRTNYRYNKKEKIQHEYKAYYGLNKEKIQAAKKAYYGLNKEKIQAAKKAYYGLHQDDRKAYYGLNKEKIQDDRKAYYGLNKEKIQDDKKAYYGLHKERIKQHKKAYYHKKKRANMTINESLYAFKNSIIWGAIYPCICCHRTRFRNGVIRMNITKLKEYEISMEALDYKFLNTNSIFFVKNAFWLCHTCISYIRKKKLPNISSKNALQTFDRPECLKLSEVENVLIAPRINFIKMIKLPVSRMKGMRDRIVNVPIASQKLRQTVETLPRTLEEAQVIPISLRKKKSMVGSHYQQYICPNKIRQAVKFLIGKYPFYKDVQFNMHKINSDYDKEIDDCEEDLLECDCQEVKDNIIDDIDEDIAEEIDYIEKDAVRKYQSETSNSSFLLPENIEANIKTKPKKKKDHGLILAPGEDQIPRNILREKHPFVLHFPCLFPDGEGGLHDPGRKKKITTQQWIMQRLQNVNMMFSQNKPFLFTAVHYVEQEQLMKRMNISYMRGKVTNNEDGHKFLQTEDGFAVFDGLPGSPRYWQKMKFDLIAKMEQLGPPQFFYTLSCANKRWEENTATILVKTKQQMKVMYTHEEKEQEVLLDLNVKVVKEKEEYDEEDEDVDMNEDVVILTEKRDAYFIHENIQSTPFQDVTEVSNCAIHQGCKRTDMKTYLDKKAETELQSENVLEITRNFDNRIRAFRKNILMASQSPLQVRYYHDRVEFQARGHPHIHGMAWSKMASIDEKYAGVQDTFKKLKERRRLNHADILPLRKFIDATITCSTSITDLTKWFYPTPYEESDLSDNCTTNCDPRGCLSCAYQSAKLVRQRVFEVNTHHHTKTCAKKGQNCRFGIPRPPSEFTIIAQSMPNEIKKSEVDTVKSLEYIMGKVEVELKNIEDNLNERIDTNDDIPETEGSLSIMLEKLFPIIQISDDERTIFIKEEDKEYHLKTELVKETWQQNPKCDAEPISLLAPRERLRSAVYHYALSVSDNGTKVVLKRRMKDILVNNYNPDWMLAWDGNMDLQPILDYFSCITYMTDYVCKAETKTTQLLKDVKRVKKKENASNKELMYALAQAYLTSREMGECEAYYKLDPNLCFKQSNVKTIFIGTGFPQNRAKFLRKCKNEAEYSKGICVDGHDGKFLESESYHIKYAGRPECIEKICFCQFCMRFTLISYAEASKIKKDGRHPAPPEMGKGYEGILYIVTGDGSDNIKLPDFIVLENNKTMKLRKYDAVIRRHKFKSDKEQHEFFYSELLLFWPWRNESELFPDDAEKCANLYLKVKPTIDAVKETLFPHLNDVELGREMVENFEFDINEIGATVDPEGEQADDPDAIAEIAEEYAGLDPEGLANVEDQSNVEKVPIPIFRTPPLLETEDLFKKTRFLVWEQMIVLQKIVEYCRHLVTSRLNGTKKSQKPPLLIVHGGAGTGKSMLIEVLSLWIQKLLMTSGDDPCSPYLVLAAPTGMAASNINGQTIHTAFNFSFGNKYQPLSDKKRDDLRDTFKNVTVVIIDEFSMMKSSSLYHLHMRLCDLKQTDEVMGGISVILLGDLMQLKPIQGDYIFQQPKYGNLKDVFEVFNLWEQFQSVVLEKNHRQGEDKSYAELLGRLRFKEKDEELSKEDSDLLNSRIVQPDDLESTIQIFGLNGMVNSVNESRLEFLTTKLFTIEARHLPKSRSPTIQSSGAIENTAFLQTLRLKVNARVMLIHNINTLDGLSNGQQGEVVDILEKDGKVQFIMVRFNNESIGMEQRRKFKHLQAVSKNKAWIPIEKLHYHYPLGDMRKNHGARVTLIQFPLKLAWSLTAHKSQGQTIRQPNSVFADLNTSFQQAMSYVILSRVTSLNQLYLTKFDAKKIYCNKLAKREAGNLRARAINFVSTDWDQKKNNQLNISSLNVRSFQQHQKDLKKDEFIMKSDILCVQETWLDSDPDEQLLGYHAYYLHGRSKGIAIFTRLTPIATHNFQSDICSIMKSSFDDFDLVNIYRAHFNMNLDQFREEILPFIDVSRTQILIGDFNINLLKTPQNVLTSFLQQLGYRQLVMKPTHNQGGLIDHVYFFSPNNFVTCDLFKYHTVFWSDHTCQSLIVKFSNEQY